MLVGVPLFVALPSTTISSNIWTQIIPLTLVHSVFIIPISLGQALIFRRYIQNASCWLIASCISCGLILPGILSLASLVGGEDAAFVTSIFGIGFITGAAQWQVLRYLVHNAGFWIVMCGIAWIVCLFGVESLFSIFESIGIYQIGIISYIEIIILWAAYVELTGFVLLWLLREPFV
jgi:hypothetical protein